MSTPAGLLDGATVTAVDAELGRDDPLATAETAADGSYELGFDASGLDGPFEGAPDVYLRVSHSGLSYETGAVGFDGETATLDVALGGSATGAGTPADAGSSPVGDGGRSSSGGMASGGKPHHGMRNVPRDPSHPGQGLRTAVPEPLAGGPRRVVPEGTGVARRRSGGDTRRPGG